MKKYLFGFLLFGFLTANAQSVTDYKYIIIPEKFSGFDEHQYQLDRLFNLLMSKKNYEILSPEKFDWPAEVQKNPCLALNSDIEKMRSFLNNKLELRFTDCNGKEIFKNEGVSRIKEFDKGYQDALRQAANKIGLQNAPENQVAQSMENQNPSMPGIQDEQIANSGSNTYSNGETLFTKSELKDSSFLLIQQDNSRVYAQFYPTSKPGVFRVKIIDPKGEGYFTVGYENPTSISIEFISNQNDIKLVEFRKIMR